MKKRNVYLLLVILLNVLFMKGVSAKSEYFDHIWTYDATTSEWYVGYVTNDVIEVEGGYLTVGFDREYPVIALLDQDGELKKEVTINSNYRGRLKRVFATDEGYVAIGIDGGQLYSLVLSSKFKVVDSNNYWVSGYSWDGSEIYVIKSGDNLYIFNDYLYGNEIVSYSIEDDDFSEVSMNSISKDDKALLSSYFNMLEYDDCFGNNLFTAGQSDKNTTSGSSYCSVFIEPYNGGYVFGLYDWDNDKSKVVYYTEDEVWSKTYSNKFIKDGVQVNDNFLLVGNDYNEEDAFFYMLDSNGKIIETVGLDEYFKDKNL